MQEKAYPSFAGRARHPGDHVPMVISAAVRSSPMALEATALEATGIMTTLITTTTLIAGSFASCAAAIAVCGFAIDHAKLCDLKTPITAANLLNVCCGFRGARCQARGLAD
jgi:hypothetical protein